MSHDLTFIPNTHVLGQLLLGVLYICASENSELGSITWQHFENMFIQPGQNFEIRPYKQGKTFISVVKSICFICEIKFLFTKLFVIISENNYKLLNCGKSSQADP